MASQVKGFLLGLVLVVACGPWVVSPRPRAESAPPAPGVVTSLTGSAAGDGGPAVNAWLNEPEAVAVDAAGNLYIGDTKNCVVRKVDVTGTITTIVGTGICGFNGDSIPGTSAQLTLPRGVTVDGADNVYIADAGSPADGVPGSCRIRKLDAHNTLSTVAGSGSCDYAGDGGPATSAALKNAKSTAIDSHGALYIADYDNCRIRKVQDNVISTVAGGSCDVVDPFGITIDRADNIYVADAGNSRIERLIGGSLVTISGAPEIAQADGVAVDTSGNLFIADTDHCVIKEIASSALASAAPPAMKTIAGTGACGYTGDGDALSTALNYPGGVAVDPAGNLFVADTLNCRIRKISGSTIVTVAGNGACHTVKPVGVAVDASGTVFVSDSYALDCHVLMITRDGEVSRRAGLPTIGHSATQLPCGFSGDGPAVGVRLNGPTALALDGRGDLYIADTVNCRIRKVSGGQMTTAAGFGSCQSAGNGGPAANAAIDAPRGIAVDGAGRLYIADTESCVVRRVEGGAISTIAGTGLCGFQGDDGAAAQAQLNNPAGLAVDAAGNLYIADTMNCRIREVEAATGNIRSIAGDGNCADGADRSDPKLASLNHPSAVAVDAFGQLFIADTDNCRIRELGPSRRLIFTIAGNGLCAYGGDGGPATSASFNKPGDVTVDGEGNVYIADSENGRVRVVSAPDRNGDGRTDVQELAASVDPDANATPLVATARPPITTLTPPLSSPIPSPQPAPAAVPGAGRPRYVIPLIVAGIVAAALAVATVGAAVSRRRR